MPKRNCNPTKFTVSIWDLSIVFKNSLLFLIRKDTAKSSQGDGRSEREIQEIQEEMEKNPPWENQI